MHRRLLLTAAPALGVAMFTDSPLAQSAPNQGAAKPMLVSSGGASGTYHRLMKEFDEAAPGLIVNTDSDGSLTNIDRVMDNQAELGITQLDALYFRAMKETNLKERIRVLAVLHAEEIHFIGKTHPRSEGGLFGLNGTPIKLESLDDLRGRKIGFWGGGVITEQIIASMTLVGWAPVEYIDQKPALEALRDDQVDAVLAVGGQPLAWVSDLSRDVRLLNVPDQIANRLGQVYEKTTLTYRNLGQEGVPTLAVRALLVTHNYTSKAKHDQLQMIHDRFAAAVGEIRETRGTHPKWMEVDPTATTDKWPMYLGAHA